MLVEVEMYVNLSIFVGWRLIRLSVLILEKSGCIRTEDQLVGIAPFLKTITFILFFCCRKAKSNGKKRPDANTEKTHVVVERVARILIAIMFIVFNG